MEYRCPIHGKDGPYRDCVYCNDTVSRDKLVDNDPTKPVPVIPYKNPSEKQIHSFASGASSSGHILPYDMLTPTLLARAARRMQKGVEKYKKNDWKKGVHDKKFIVDRLNHAMGHLIKATYEIENGIPMTDDDLAAVVVNCMMAMEYQLFDQRDLPDMQAAATYRLVFGLPQINGPEPPSDESNH